MFNSSFGRLDKLSWEKLDGCLKGSQLQANLGPYFFNQRFLLYRTGKN